MKDYSVTPRASHKFELGITAYDRQNGKQCLIVGYAGLEQSPSYCVQCENDPGMAESMPFRYVSESDLTVEEVKFSTDADEIIARLSSDQFVANREQDFLVTSGSAVYIYGDADSNRPTGIRLKDYRDIDGNIYSDQAGLEEHPGRL